MPRRYIPWRTNGTAPQSRRRPIRCFALIVSALAFFTSSAAADYLVTAFDETYYPINPENGYGGFTWGDFSYSGMVTDGATSITIDATNLDGMNNVSGGIGNTYPVHTFDAGLAEWEVRFRVLSNNTASAFRTTYIDDDGPGTTWPRRATEFGFDFSITGLPINQWQTITKPLGSYSFAQTAYQSDPGDGIQNPGLNQIQLQSVFNSTGRLNVEFDYLRINSLGDLPPPYAGAEPDAPWRAEASTRIDAIRKADLQVTVRDALGNPLPDATVGVHMQRHEFGFGSAVAGDRLASNSPAQNTYKQKVEELFNLATVENHLKWPPWEGEWGPTYSQQNAMDAVQWLNDHNIDARGHVLVWPGYNNLPNAVKNILNGGVTVPEQQQLRNAVANHITDIGAEFAGQLVVWDVVNEERTNHDIMDNLPEGDGAMVDWFEQGQTVDPQAKRYINEWGILSSGGDTNSANQQTYYDTIDYLVDNSAPIDGIGFQSHFAYNPGTSTNTLTGPEQVWEILDRFADLGLDMQVTEFDVNTTDEEVQAMFTRDFLTAVFAHEGMDDFVMWGFWEDAHWLPDAAMFRSDWSIKPNGQEFLDLVFGEWWTDEDVNADALGEALVRAFKGEHEVSAAFGEFADTVDATLTDGGLLLNIELPFLLGDYNRDGVVNGADYTVWRDSFDDLVAAGTAADGNNNSRIDDGDFDVWRQHYGNALPGAAGSAAVPEPVSAWLAATWLVWLLASRNRTRFI